MYVAVDIGGTKTLVALFDAHGKQLRQLKFPTPKDYAEFLKDLGSTFKELKVEKPLRAVVAVPGKVDRTKGIAIAFGNLEWENLHIQKDIKKLLHCPVRIENDANLAGLSEALLLKGKYKKVLYITVSTGIGGVLVVNGTMDPDTLDAEPGQMLLEHDGKLQRWEEFASGKAIVARFGRRASDIDVSEQAIWYAVSRNIAIGLIDLIAVYTPDAVVIGGGAGSNLHKFLDRLLEQLEIYENPLLSIPVIRQAANAEEAVIYGCYALAKDSHASAD
jgi:glucokinase